MENKKKNTGAIALVVLLLIITIASLVLATYAWAKYTTTTEGAATGQVARWNISASSTEDMFTQGFSQVLDERIAPGTSGNVTATLDIQNTEVDVNYEMVITSVDVVNGDIPEYFVIKANDNNTIIYQNKEIVDDGVFASGAIQKEASEKSVTKNLYWEWPYDNGDDEQDTADGENPGTITIHYEIRAVQDQPIVQK